MVGVVIPSAIDRVGFQRIMDRGPYEFVSVDSQHSALSENGLVDLCALAGEFGMPVQFRIKHTRNTYLIGNYLDLGPAGVEVPQVEMEGTVDEAIEYFYFPPAGRRSVGGGARLRVGEFADPFDYAEWWNGHGLLWMQLESVQAVEKVFCLAREGVDCVSFGPTDLSFDLRNHPHPRLETVDDCVRSVVRTLEDVPVAVCFRTYSPDRRQRYLDMGVGVILEHHQHLVSRAAVTGGRRPGPETCSLPGLPTAGAMPAIVTKVIVGEELIILGGADHEESDRIGHMAGPVRPRRLRRAARPG